MRIMWVRLLPEHVIVFGDRVAPDVEQVLLPRLVPYADMRVAAVAGQGLPRVSRSSASAWPSGEIAKYSHSTP